MGERVIVRQGSDFATTFLAGDPEQPAAAPREVERIHELTPYGMLLAGLGTCTAILLHSYAAKRGLPLRTVVATLTYDRRFARDCETCQTDGRYDEEITMELELVGDLDRETRDRLMQVSRHCPVEKVLEQGISVTVRPASPEMTA